MKGHIEKYQSFNRGETIITTLLTGQSTILKFTEDFDQKTIVGMIFEADFTTAAASTEFAGIAFLRIRPRGLPAPAVLVPNEEMALDSTDVLNDTGSQGDIIAVAPFVCAIGGTAGSAGSSRVVLAPKTKRVIPKGAVLEFGWNASNVGGASGSLTWCGTGTIFLLD